MVSGDSTKIVKPSETPKAFVMIGLDELLYALSIACWLLFVSFK
jgi:hypothetical protein